MRRLRVAAALRPRRRALDLAPWPAYLVLATIVVAGLALRLRSNGYGLPYAYNIDEGSHFTNRAVALFGGSLNPRYFQNPSNFTYLEHLALRFQFGHLWPLGDLRRVPRQFSVDPSSIYRTGRTLAAVLCMLGVAGVFHVGRRLWGALEGLVAAAALSFAFLPVVYSRIAVTDTGTLLPVALSVYASVRAFEGGRRRHFVLAGAAAGVAIGFKYTAGLLLVPLLVAGAGAARRERRALLHAGLGVGAAALVFVLTNPYFILDFHDAWRQIRGQAETAGGLKKLGQEQYSGPGYYAQSLTWGLGWAAAAAALCGAALELRRGLLRGAVLLAFPLALFAYLCLQSRYFGRWLLPGYPVLALLAGATPGRGVRRLPLRPSLKAGTLAIAALAVLAQPLAADVRTARLLARTDTRQLARDWLVKRFRPRLRIVIEPAVPGRYYRLVRPRRPLPPTRKQFVRGFIKDIRETRLDYAATLRPETIDRYRRSGFCLVMSMSVIRGRAENARLAPALAYYARLRRESRVLFRASPYKPGAKPVPFSFDLSYNYYPSAFERPGPEIAIYQLKRCREGYGPVPRGTGTPAGASEPPGTGTAGVGKP
jgi:Dolichyl-phosphate-mannose-protein mannosyltransferase